MSEAPTQPSPSLSRIILRAFLAIPTSIILLTLAGLITVNVLRDRNWTLLVLMYIPLWPAAAATVLWDLLLLGRALPLRFLMTCIGLAAGILAFGMMWSPARAAEGRETQPSIKILHWNTQWGGRRAQGTLDEMVDEMSSRSPDIVCLSESPHIDWLKFTWNRRVPGAADWRFATLRNRQPSDYWYALTVMSRFPVRLVGDFTLKHGHAALFEVEVPQTSAGPARTMRVLMVDIESYWRLERSPTILQAAKIVDDFGARGMPIDVIAGDFNAPARCYGFDTLARSGEGYERAAFWSGQWRATWPTYRVIRGREFKNAWRVSALDIDHIFLRKSIDVASAEIFENDGTDHRGQTATVRLK